MLMVSDLYKNTMTMYMTAVRVLKCTRTLAHTCISYIIVCGGRVHDGRVPQQFGKWYPDGTGTDVCM